MGVLVVPSALSQEKSKLAVLFGRVPQETGAEHPSKTAVKRIGLGKET
jgi:hypothetical protein